VNSFSIGMLCPSPSWGGLEMNVERISRWLSDRGHRVVFIGDPESELYNRLASSSAIISTPLESSSKASDLIRAPQLAAAVRTHNIQILISHLNRNFLLIALARKMLGKKCRLTYMQHMHVGGTKRDMLHTWMHRQLDAWITPLEMFVNPLLQKTRLKQEQIAVIPFGIELDRFTSKRPTKSDARRKLGLPEEAIVAGVVGRLDPKKGQHVLIEACARVHREGHRIHILIVGDESRHEITGYAEQLRATTRDLQLESYVQFFPHFDDVETAYAAMDVFALTSQSETYGMVTIEAMASGLAVIGTNEGGTPGIIEDGVNGLLVPPMDAESLASALLRVISDEDLRKRLAESAKREAVEKYSHIRQCELLEQLFERLVAENAQDS